MKLKWNYGCITTRNVNLRIYKYLVLIILILSSVIVAISCGGGGSSSDKGNEDPINLYKSLNVDFTIAHITDTHVGQSKENKLNLCERTEWINANAEKEHILFVLHSGDITDHNTQDEWNDANECFHGLDHIVPVFKASGNHDIAGLNQQRNSGRFDQTFNKDRTNPIYGYVASFEDRSLSNSYYRLEKGGIKWLIITIEYAPRNAVLEWANTIISANNDRRVIIVTHAYMSHQTKRIGALKNDPYIILSDDHSYKDINQGEDIWNKLVRKHSNIIMVLSGHVPQDSGYLRSLGDNGNFVHQLMHNAQQYGGQGNHGIRLFHFDESANKVFAAVYSEKSKSYVTQNNESFIIYGFYNNSN